MGLLEAVCLLWSPSGKEFSFWRITNWRCLYTLWRSGHHEAVSMRLCCVRHPTYMLWVVTGSIRDSLVPRPTQAFLCGFRRKNGLRLKQRRKAWGRGWHWRGHLEVVSESDLFLPKKKKKDLGTRLIRNRTALTERVSLRNVYLLSVAPTGRGCASAHCFPS